ncbi:hypothetical protein INT48_007359 [Thamnidium elegans]|uniref:Uncharacterized protein n=1 Tax=Thamnidium elegans TaxID=101142 RepID=A0A8H7VU12_9FUNG|nr:hypothetical protein INT48_007359 [Thamnidium elegans]
MATTATFPKIICRVKALYAFSSTEKSSLSFDKGEYIEVLSQLDSGWWDGWCRGNRGWFPSNYVQIIDINPELVQEMNFSNSGRTSPTSPTPFPPQQNDDDSEEEARTINLIRNMNNGSNLTSPINLSRPQSFTLPTPKHSNFIRRPPPPPLSQQQQQYQHHQQQQQQHIQQQQQQQQQQQHKNTHMQQQYQAPIYNDEDDNDEIETNLPEGWTLQVADDGLTKFYFNQQTGGLRWNHPGISDSDDEGDDSSTEEYYQEKQLNHFDDYDFGKSPSIFNNNNNNTDYNQFPTPPPIKERTVDLVAHWIKKTTPQGKVYYGNSITHETTWDYNEIDPETGRLKKNTGTTNVTKVSSETTPKDRSGDMSSSSSMSSLAMIGEEDAQMTWKSIAIEIAQSVQNLNKAVVRGESLDSFRQKIATVVDAVRLMLYSSRSLDKDAAHLQDIEIRDPHRNVLSTLAKLILSAKVVNDSGLDINGKVQRDAADVLNSVRKFVLICQTKNVKIEQVNPRLLLNSTNAITAIITPVNISGGEDLDEMTSTANKRKSSTTSSNTARAKYPLNQDLIVSLQTHAKQIVGSTDALCKASAYIYTLEEKQQQEEASEEQAYTLDQRARSNVVLLFQNLSTQIGNYLAILGDIDTNHIDPTQIQSLPEFRSNKQKLYNAVGLLFSAVQTLTDTQNDLTNSITAIETAVATVENSIEDIFSDIVQMVGERKIWLMRNDASMITTDGGPRSPVNTYFETDTKKRPHRGSINDSDVNPTEGSSGVNASTPILSRIYNRQGSQQGLNPQQQSLAQQHRPSIGNVTPSNLTRPTPESQALKRQFSFGHGVGSQDDKSQFWYLGYDYAEGDIVFTIDKSIKGGTLRALVERLTLHDFIDMSFIANFLLTYRSFCTTDEFVELLQERYNLAPPEELTPDELEIWTDKKQKLVRLRVFNVMKNWLENYYNDEDEFILNKLQFFANTVICDSSSFSAEQLNRLIRKRRELDANGGGLKKLIPNAMSGPMPIVPKNMQHIRLLDTDPLEVARQLTIMDFKLYSSIRPIECLGKAWSKDSSENAVNVKQSIDYCNQLTSWVTGSILSNKEAKKRVVVIKHWSQVANRCLEMNNYNTCMAILSAFDNSAIGRLKKTWELVSSRTSQSLAHIRKLMGSNRNFTEYREMIHSVNPPCIPFLGIYLQDLTFIEDGNPDLLKKSSSLINFAKQQKSAEVIREIKQFQSPPYIFHIVPEIQEFIKFQLETSRDVDFLYERSLELEPRVNVTDNTA